MMMMMVNIIFSCRPISLAVLCREIIGPFIREKIRRVLAKPRLILDEMYRLYGKFASYFSSYKWP